jgi:hypothetical protein
VFSTGKLVCQGGVEIKTMGEFSGMWRKDRRNILKVFYAMLKHFFQVCQLKILFLD